MEGFWAQEQYGPRHNLESEEDELERGTSKERDARKEGLQYRPKDEEHELELRWKCWGWKEVGLRESLGNGGDGIWQMLSRVVGRRWGEVRHKAQWRVQLESVRVQSSEKWPQRTGTLLKDVQRNRHRKKAGIWTWIASTSWLLWIVLLWTWVNNSIFLSMKCLPGRKRLKIKHLNALRDPHRVPQTVTESSRLPLYLYHH